MSAKAAPFLIAAAVLLPWQNVVAAERVMPDREAIKINYAYADCVVRRQHELAARAILSDASNSDIWEHYSRLIMPECLVGGNMRFGGDLYRYALAGALVKRDLASRSLQELKSIPALEHLAMPAATPEGGKPRSAKEQQYYAHAVANTFLSEYGECVVRADPVHSRALLFSKPTSIEEADMFRTLMPALSDCMPSGETVHFGPLTLRGSIAINYYRLAYATHIATPPKAPN